MKILNILASLFFIISLGCKKETKQIQTTTTSIGKRSFAIIYYGKIEVYKSNLNSIEYVPGADSGVSQIAVDSGFTKIAYKTDSSNIKIVDIATGNVLEEIQDTKYAKDFHFHKTTNAFYYLSNSDIIIAPHDNMPFMNKSLSSITGFVSNSYTNIFIIRNSIVVIDANQSHIAYFVNDGTGVVDNIISNNTYQHNFVVINEYNNLAWLDVIFHDVSGQQPKLSNHYGNKTAGDENFFVAQVANGNKITIDDGNNKIEMSNSLGITSKQFNNFYLTDMAF